MKHYIPFFSLLILTYFHAEAQSQKMITYGEAIQTALRENIEARTQENQLEVLKAEKLQGYAAFLPTADVVINTERASGNQFIPEFDRLVNTVSESFWGQVGADIDLFTGFSRINTLKRNSIRLASQENRIQRAKQTVVSDVTQQYLQVLLDEELLRIAENNLETQQEILTSLKSLVEEGIRGMPEQYLQATEVSRMETMIIQRRNSLISNKLIFAQLLQLDPTEDFKLAPPDWQINDIREKVFNVGELYETATSTRPDLLQAGLDEEAAQYATKIAKARYLPRANAYYRHRSFWNSVNEARSFSEQFGEDNVRKTLGASLIIPIFGGLQNRTQFISAQIDYENARLTRQNTDRTVRIDVKNAYQNFLAAKQGLEASEAQLEMAEQSYNAQKQLFDNAMSDLVNLARSNNTLVVSQANLAQARFTMLFQEVMLKHATGELNPTELVSQE